MEASWGLPTYPNAAGLGSSVGVGDGRGAVTVVLGAWSATDAPLGVEGVLGLPDSTDVGCEIAFS
jgi:hypothetical protein